MSRKVQLIKKHKSLLKEFNNPETTPERRREIMKVLELIAEELRNA